MLFQLPADGWIDVAVDVFIEDFEHLPIFHASPRGPGRNCSANEALLVMPLLPRRWIAEPLREHFAQGKAGAKQPDFNVGLAKLQHHPPSVER